MLDRCFTTGNRSYLPSISDFDAIIMNQRSIDWGDMPEKLKFQILDQSNLENSNWMW